MPSFHEQHGWHYVTDERVWAGQAVRELRRASARSEEVLTRLYDIRAKLDDLYVRAAELARDARPGRTSPRP
jgi:hypothetical protein